MTDNWLIINILVGVPLLNQLMRIDERKREKKKKEKKKSFSSHTWVWKPISIAIMMPMQTKYYWAKKQKTKQIRWRELSVDQVVNAIAIKWSYIWHNFKCVCSHNEQYTCIFNEICIKCLAFFGNISITFSFLLKFIFFHFETRKRSDLYFRISCHSSQTN